MFHFSSQERESAEGEEIISLLNSHPQSILSLNLTCILCSVPYSLTLKASRSKVIFYSPETIATPLLCCFELLGIIQTEQKEPADFRMTPACFSGSCQAHSESSGLAIFKLQYHGPEDIQCYGMAAYLEREIWLWTNVKLPSLHYPFLLYCILCQAPLDNRERKMSM